MREDRTDYPAVSHRLELLPSYLMQYLLHGSFAERFSVGHSFKESLLGLLVSTIVAWEPPASVVVGGSAINIVH